MLPKAVLGPLGNSWARRLYKNQEDGCRPQHSSLGGNLKVGRPASGVCQLGITQVLLGLTCWPGGCAVMLQVLGPGPSGED